jgi:arylsulfatase A-like enzyme
MSRRYDCLTKLLVAVIATGLFLAGVSPAAPGRIRPPRKPNVLLIVADDLGYGELSVQGNPQVPTPHIDSIAKNGTRFTSAYVSAPYCSPTRAALLTGRYQQRFGYEFNPSGVERASPAFGLPVEETTIADRLKAAGYATGMFGKWHLGWQPQHHPQKRGFEDFVGFLGGARSYLDVEGEDSEPVLRGRERVPRVGHSTELFAKEASAFIEVNRDRPWFAYLAFNAVHAPLESSEKYLSRFAQIEDPRRRKFAAVLTAMDDAVGDVLAKLRTLDLEDDTLIFFLSDNGGPTRTNTSQNGPLRGYKAQTWEGGIRVPFMVQWKGRLPAGRVDERPVIQLDVLPTALAAAGVEVRREWKVDGVDLLPWLRGHRRGSPHPALYWRLGPQMAIRKGDWKLVKAHGGGTEFSERKVITTTDGAQLYNLGDDIGETRDLAGAEPGRVRELKEQWDRWNAQLQEPRWFPGRVGDVEAPVRREP